MLGLVSLLTACNQSAPEPEPPKSDLDRAALEAGLITDPDMLDLAGTFETRSALGNDRFCAVGNRDTGYDIGMLAIFGANLQCEARGSATINGETITLVLTKNNDGDAIGDCAFTASFDGVVIRIPGQLPKGCAQACSNRASFAGVNFSLAETGNEAALRLKGEKLHPPLSIGLGSSNVKLRAIRSISRHSPSALTFTLA